MRPLQRLACASLCATASFSVLATECDSAYSSYQSFSYLRSEILANHPECFGGSANNAQVLINATSGRQWSAISQQLAQRQIRQGAPSLAYQPEQRGLAAGEAMGSWTIWANVLDDDTRQSYRNAFDQRVKNDADVVNSILGVDYTLNPQLVLGLSLAIDRGDISGRTTANPGNTNKLNSKGWMLAPYVGWQLTPELSLDASIGLGEGKLDASGGDGSQEADRWFAGVNLVYSRWVGNWQFGGRAGYLHAEEDYAKAKAFGTSINDTNAKNKIDQIQLGGQLGYWYNGFMPYAGLKFVDDINRSNSLDGSRDQIGREAWVWTLGLNYYSLAHGITAGLAFEQEAARSHQARDTLTANISLRL